MCLRDSERRGDRREGKKYWPALLVCSPELLGRIGEEKGNYYRGHKVTRKHTSGFILVLETGKTVPFP